ncbi:MAG: hypothetical protein MUC33_01265 [Desulfobacterales bacterium]|jgi:hypothetical protein|nr:hypothetical protein [Desulfobacterales bacterium]MCU0601272.1 hypothetical protein [Desulfobacterales bacterium]
MAARIRYRCGYKYQLVNDHRAQLAHVRPEFDIVTEFIELTVDGLLWIKHGYAWDGPSGPTVDTPNFMRGSLVHDALAQLMRDGYIGTDQFTAMNRELRDICIEAGMSCIRAAWVFAGVEYCGNGWCRPGSDGGRKLMEAP